MGVGGESLLQMEALRHVVTRVTDEGLIVEIFAREGAPIFKGNTREPTPVMVELLTAFTPVFAMVRNPIAIDGHVRAQPLVLAENPVWDISAGRAEAVRARLVSSGLDEDRMARLTGHADREPATAEGSAIRNDRIEITLLRSQ
jgi:chemotaxis protein MotB